MHILNLAFEMLPILCVKLNNWEILRIYEFKMRNALNRSSEMLLGFQIRVGK
jgi:hypothetical protein